MRNAAARLAVVVLAAGVVTGASPASAHSSCSATGTVTTAVVTQNNEVSGTGTVNCTFVHDLYSITLTFQYRTTPGVGGWTTVSPTFTRNWTNANSPSVSHSGAVFCPASAREWRVVNDWTAGDGAHSGHTEVGAVVVVCL